MNTSYWFPKIMPDVVSWLVIRTGNLFLPGVKKNLNHSPSKTLANLRHWQQSLVPKPPRVFLRHTSNTVQLFCRGRRAARRGGVWQDELGMCTFVRGDCWYRERRRIVFEALGSLRTALIWWTKKPLWFICSFSEIEQFHSAVSWHRPRKKFCVVATIKTLKWSRSDIHATVQLIYSEHVNSEETVNHP